MSFLYNVNIRNVNQALNAGLRLLSGNLGIEEPSRNGSVKSMSGPVMTIYSKPTERVLFSPLRDANPFFHLFEALWMLAGRNDLPWLVQFNRNFGAYSDDGGITQPAAYGHRWRNYFGYDQLDYIVKELTSNPGTRRATLAMWDGGNKDYRSDSGDLQRVIAGSADIPCNTHCYFRVIRNSLDMTVMCRSNDILWGAYGANAVHFSVLLEYVAARCGLDVGTMYQFSNNFHYYTAVIDDPHAMALDAASNDFYATERVKPMPMFQDTRQFMADLPLFMDWASPTLLMDSGGPQAAIVDPFIGGVAVPMRQAWAAHKAKEYGQAEAICGLIVADDWRIASRQWMERRALKHREKNDG